MYNNYEDVLKEYSKYAELDSTQFDYIEDFQKGNFENSTEFSEWEFAEELYRYEI